MKCLYLIILLFLFGACSKPQYALVSLPDEICTLTLDSVRVNSDVILNPTGIVATSDYLIVSNLLRDTIFDVFDRLDMRYLYSDLIYGNGPGDMLPFRWIRSLRDNDFYTVGLGVPVLTEIEVGSGLDVIQRKRIEWEQDICQNLYPLSGNKVLIQPGKKCGEWSIYDTMKDKVDDLPEFPFKRYEKADEIVSMFQNRAVDVAVSDDGSRIAFFYVMFPFVRFFNDDGTVMTEACVGDEMKDVSNFFHDRHMYYTGCKVVGDYIFVKYNPKEQDSDSTCFQIWDWNGCLINTFNVRSRFNLFAVSPDAKTLYAVKADNDYIFECNLNPVWEKITEMCK